MLHLVFQRVSCHDLIKKRRRLVCVAVPGVLSCCFNQACYLSDYYIKDASFFKVDNVTLGYTFPQIFKSAKLDRAMGLNIYATVLDSVEVIVNKAPQTIVWNNNFENVSVSDTIVLNASAKTTITYEVSDTDVATLEGNILSFHRGGTINVTAYAAESELYLADTLVCELIVTPAKPIIYTWPTASGITYGQLLGASILTGGEASTDGIFEWVDPNEKFEAGVSPALVRFTPDDLSSFDIVENHISTGVDIFCYNGDGF